MPKKTSAGILLFRMRDGQPEVFLVHPGGPYWMKKDAGAWSIPKGEVDEGGDLLLAARREFAEETGAEVSGKLVSLAPLKQRSGKVVHAWAVEGDLDPSALVSNTFAIEWPPRSGKMASFPEIDRGEWFDLPTARVKLLPGQRGFLEELEAHLRRR